MFMISISLSEKFCCQNLITSIKVINMTALDNNLHFEIYTVVSLPAEEYPPPLPPSPTQSANGVAESSMT